jgi:hypothetical protein
VNGIAGRYTQFHPEVIGATAPRAASKRAAAVGAAYIALLALFPAQKATFDAQLEATLPKFSDGNDDGGSQAWSADSRWGGGRRLGLKGQNRVNEPHDVRLVSFRCGPI